MLPMNRPTLRPFAADDEDGVIALVDRVYREYGERLCLKGADRDLTDIPGTYLQPGGSFVVLAGDTILGSHAMLPLDRENGTCTFRRLYLDSSLRGTGWGETLMDWAVEDARGEGFQRVEFWSDTRFTRAHRFFERIGFQRDGRSREMVDGWSPYQEYFFWRDLGAPEPSSGSRSPSD
jgi:putative acetyltransferase